MIVKMLTHMHIVMYTWWCYHICEGGGVWAVEMVLGPSLPTPMAEVFSQSSWIETKVNGGLWGDRTLNRTQSRHDQTRPVSSSRVLRTCAPARPVTYGTGVSGQAPEGQQTQRGDRTRWRVRSWSTGRVRSCVSVYWNRPDAGTVASGQFK
jgi:hypothetical protein